MRTAKTISNISYNTPEFFATKIKELQKTGVIEWAYWIAHAPDEDGKEPHIHFVLRPSAAIETNELRKFLMEADTREGHEGLMLSPTTVWRNTSSISDWLLYAVHDAPYLHSKGLKRNNHYKFDDLCSTDNDALRQDWNMIDRTQFDRLSYLLKAVIDNTPFAVLVQRGLIPISQRAQYEHQYRSLYLMLHSSEEVPAEISDLLTQLA